MAGSVKSVLVRLKGDSSDLDRALLKAAASAKTTKRAMDDADDSTKKWTKSLEVSNDRTTMLIQGALALGPALVPIGAQAVPIFMGLAAQLGAVAAGAGVTVLAFSGVGDALKAVNDYALQPTEAHLQKMRLEMSQLGPAGQEFVRYLQELRPELQRLQDIAQEGMLPGVTDGIEQLMTKLPEVERMVYSISTTMSGLARDAANDLTGPQWAEFFDYIETEAGPLLSDFSRTVGNFAQGIADMFVAFDPTTRDFSDGMLRISESFAEWADGLAETEGFRDFLDYLERTGPQVWDTLGAIAEAMVAIVTAAAPVGEVALPAIEALAKSITALAGSPIGPWLIGAAAGFSALSRAIALAQAANASAFGGVIKNLVTTMPAVTAVTKNSIPTLGQFGTVLYGLGQSADHASKKTLAARESVAKMRPVFGAAAAGVGVLALSMTDLDEKMGVSNMLMWGAAGAAFGPYGAAAGAAAGAVRDAATANDDLFESLRSASEALSSSSTPFEAQEQAVEQARQKLAEFKADTDGWIDSMWRPGAIKNNFEGWFGESDVEEAEAQLRALEKELKQAERDSLAFGGSVSGATRALQQHEQSILANVEAMRALRDERLRARNAELNYEASIDDADKAAEENGKTLDKTTEKGRANWSALLQLAEGWNGLSDRMKNADGAHKRAIDTFVRVATQMGMNADKARELARRLLEIPPKAETKILVDAGVAFRTIDGVRMALRNLDGTVSETYIRTIRQTVVTGKLGGEPGAADGGTVLGDRYPYGDKVLYWLAPGEEVVSNRHGQADRNRDLLRAINANRLADGGTVRATPSSHVTTNHYSYGRSGPMELTGTLNIPGLGLVDMRAVATDVVAAERRHDRITGRG